MKRLTSALVAVLALPVCSRWRAARPAGHRRQGLRHRRRPASREIDARRPGRAGRAHRRGPRRRGPRPRGHPRQARGGRRLGVVVRALPHRGARRRGGGRRRLQAHGRSSSGINIRDTSASPGRAFVRELEVPYPSIYSPDGRALLAFSGTLSPNSVPSIVVLDARAGSPRRSSASCPGPHHARRGRRGRRARAGGRVRRWVSGSSRPAASGSLLLARPGRPGGRAGLLLLPVRDPAAAGLPLLRHRALRRRPRERPPRPDARSARCSSCSASRSSSSSSARSSGPMGGWLVEWRRELTRGHGVAHDRARPGLRRAAVPLLQRDWRVHRVPGRRPGGRAAAGLPLRPRLDALHRPHPGRDLHALVRRRDRRTGRAALRRSTPSGSGCRSSSRASPTAARSVPSRSSAGTSSG